jgi:predicted DNA-binding transcriptional regulator AlpA
MKVLLRFRDLHERGIARSWAQLARLVKKSGFPAGRMLSANTRVWDEAEIDRWFEARPTENDQPLKGRAAKKGMKAKDRLRKGERGRGAQ